MSDFLCLRFKEAEIHALSTVAWTVLAADGRIHASGYARLGDIPAAVPEPKGVRRNIVIVPSNPVLLTSAHVPSKQHRHLKQVLGFVIEDQVIEPIENMHLAVPAYHAHEIVNVAAVKRELLEDWLEALEKIDILPDYLFVDVLCVPQKAGDWQLLFEEHKVLFRDNNHSGISLDKNTAESVIRLAIAKQASSYADNDSDDEEILDIDAGTGLAGEDDLHSDDVQVEKSDIHEIALLCAAPERLNELTAISADSNHSNENAPDDDAAAGRADEKMALSELDDPSLALNYRPDQEIDYEDDAEPGDELGDRDMAAEMFDDQVAVQSELDPALKIAPREFKAQLNDFIRSENIQTCEIDYSETTSELLAVNAVHTVETTLNLLQGEFSPISANAENRRFIRSASLIVAACLAVFLFVTLAGGYYLNSRADSYFAESVAIYRDIFPKQKKVIDPVKQMQRQLSGNAIGGTTSDFLPLLDAASRSLSSLETEKPSIITQLRYDVQRGHIIIDLRAQSIDVLETYKKQMSDEGLDVDILSANQDDEMTNGRMQIGRS